MSCWTTCFASSVARCREGENNEGGVGSVSLVLPNFFYDIKYAVGGVERGVDACFVGKTKLVSGSHEPNVLGCGVLCCLCRAYLPT